MAAVAFAGCSDVQEVEYAETIPPLSIEARNPEAVDVTYFPWEVLATTTTVPAAAARPPARRASRAATVPRRDTSRSVEGGGGPMRVASTAYCLTGTMANGQRVFAGAVAMNGQPMGSRWRVIETGAEYVVADRIGHGSQFDIAMPGDCPRAIRYGRRMVTIERIG